MIPKIEEEMTANPSFDHDFLSSYERTVHRWFESVVQSQERVSEATFAAIGFPSVEIQSDASGSAQQFKPARKSAGKR